MRLAALASMVVLAPGAMRGCNEAPDGNLEVHWTLPDGPGDRGVRGVGCLDWELESESTSGAGLEGALEARPGWTSCALVGWRRDGQLQVQTEPVGLDSDSVVQDIRFDLPEGPIGGMGASISSTGYGVFVHQVVPGSPADLAGIVPGDLVVDVDGTPTRHLTTEAFIRAATGVPGTAVHVEIERGDGRFGVDLIRARIP